MSFAETLNTLKELEEEVTNELDAELGLTKPAGEVESLDDLDNLLNESLALRSERGAGKALRAQLEKAKSREEAAEIEATLRAWEARHEWRTVANCALFHRQVCACGSEHTHFAGMYYHQEHRSDPHAQRWIAAVQNLAGVSALAADASAPNRTMLETRHTPMCEVCAVGSGFDLSKAEQPWK